LVEDGIPLQLWSDEPSRVDLLSFDAIAETVVQAVLDDALDPVALGLTGSWGSGKTTVLNLVNTLLHERNQDGQRVLVVASDPWRYDPVNGAKESLISEVLSALGSE
jgi:predicted KAP-like P-loop ATPase